MARGHSTSHLPPLASCLSPGCSGRADSVWPRESHGAAQSLSAPIRNGVRTFSWQSQLSSWVGLNTGKVGTMGGVPGRGRS